ncbi:MAG: TatD family hydrolase [Spirochaetales bacterium]|nr:TatD family hydrolase [Spirochaetales bacterium]
MSKKKYSPYHTYPGLIDSHTHLTHIQEKDVNLQELFLELERRNFSWILDAGVSEKNFEDRISHLANYEKLLFSVGIHPEDAEGNLTERLIQIRKQAKHEKVVAIGEIGLDYYWKDTPQSIQHDFFEAQLELASEVNLPVIIHNREADEDCYNKLKSFNLPQKGVIHCYSSNREWARKFLDIGYYISFAGNVTYKNAPNIQEAAAFVPADRILIETDAPYLSPQKRRGRTNHPGQIGYTADFIADLRNTKTEKLITQVKRNFEVLFL